MNLWTTSNKVLAALLLAQVAWLVGERALRDDPFPPPRPITGRTLFPGAATPAQVHGLTLRRGSYSTELRRSGESWVVTSEGDAPADAYFVDVALKSLAEMAPGSLVSENPERHGAYEVNDPYAVEVVAADAAGVEVAHFRVGRSTPNGRGFYIRYPYDGDDVMLITPNVRDAFDRYGNRIGAWREKSIFDVDPASIIAFEITNHDETIVVRRRVPESGITTDDDEWQVRSPRVGAIERVTANAMAAGFGELKADGFVERVDTLAEYGLETPRVRVVATLKDGTQRSLEIGDEVEKRLYVRRSDRVEVFKVNAFQLHNFLRSGEELIRD